MNEHNMVYTHMCDLCCANVCNCCSFLLVKEHCRIGAQGCEIVLKNIVLKSSQCNQEIRVVYRNI